MKRPFEAPAIRDETSLAAGTLASGFEDRLADPPPQACEPCMTIPIFP